MFSLYIFTDHAIVALSNRQFQNCLCTRVLGNDINEINKLDYIEYNNKMIKVYIPNVIGDYNADE